MTDPANTRRPSRRRRAAAARATLARAVATPGKQEPCADLREQVAPDIRAVAEGYRRPKRRDTSRRAMAITDGAWRDDLPANVDGFAAADARRWRGEARSVRPVPDATGHRLMLADPSCLPELPQSEPFGIRPGTAPEPSRANVLPPETTYVRPETTGDGVRDFPEGGRWA